MNTFQPLLRNAVLLFIGCIAILLNGTPAYAVGEFQEDYDVSYAISPSGVTIVTQNIALTNKKSNLYPEKYSILIDSKNIKNIKIISDWQINLRLCFCFKATTEYLLLG